MTLLYILGINTLSDMWIANIFSHSVGYHCILLIIYFGVGRFIKKKNYCQDQWQEAFPPMVSFRSFMNLGLTFTSNSF